MGDLNQYGVELELQINLLNHFPADLPGLYGCEAQFLDAASMQP
jgi:hypothetical protein